MASPQTLSEAARRIVAGWAADVAERILPVFEAEASGDDRPRDAIERARAFSRGERAVADEISQRFVAFRASTEAASPAAKAAALAAAHAAAVAHMGAHALAAAAYAAKATGLSVPDRPEAVDDEVSWQVEHMTPEVRATLRTLPPLGENSAGPLGTGLLTSGILAVAIRKLQDDLEVRAVSHPPRAQL